MLYQEPSGSKPEPKPRAPLPKDKVEDMAQLLRRAARRPKPWTPARILIVAVLVVVPLALVAWWLWPRPSPPQLLVVAFDQVTLPDKPLGVRAATEPLDGSDVRWGRRDLFFSEVQPHRAPGESDKKQQVKSDRQGFATVEWQFPQSPAPREIEVTYVDEQERRPWFDKDRGRVFVWPRNSRLLIVDVEPTLKKAGDWAALCKAFQDATAAGWRVVYLASASDRPLGYRKVREWALQQMRIDEVALPDGPVLGRETYFGGADDAAARQEVLAALARDFQGPLVYVGSAPGLTIQTVEPDGTFKGQARPLPGWADLVKPLPK